MVPEQRVELYQAETIVERGTREVTWFVRHADAWINVCDWPKAVVERRQAGPGTVWESRVELALPEGTRLMRVDTQPAPLEQRDALDYLARETRGVKRRVHRSYFRVGRCGELVREQTTGQRRRP
jgi:hypothetical protein